MHVLISLIAIYAKHRLKYDCKYVLIPPHILQSHSVHEYSERQTMLP